VKTLITSALPYANGAIHLGHLVEYVQTDIYVRFLRSCGEEVVYFCADDTHGTPIELGAQKAGLPPEKYVERWFGEHQKDFADFDVKFDCFWTTNSPENLKYSTAIFERLKAAGDIERREIEQTYCEKDKRFLPDRFVRGTCPNCRAPDQYGDACEKCGKAYSPTDLIDPRCALCGTPPVRKKSDHLFFKLSRHEKFLRELIRDPAFLHGGLAKQLLSFFDKGLADWDISRDGPYFGFPIPGETDKYFYVWLDAPIGYIATTEKFSGNALTWWAEDADARVIHFIGKDIVYFHALFWPAVLKVAGFKRPSKIAVHGHLTVNGEKMSKTRGTFINARPYLDLLDPSYLRFFYAANLGSGPEDLDLSLSEFRLRVNADLVNNIGNLANRTLSLLPEGKLAPAGDGALVAAALARAGEVRAAFEAREYRTAIKAICEISQAANQFLTVSEPWKKIKTDKEQARADLSNAAEVVYLLAGLLDPVVPRLSAKLFEQLAAPALTYAQVAKATYPLLDRSKPIGKASPIIARLEEEQVAKLVVSTAAPAAPSNDIEYADFEKVVLKAGKVLAAEKVPKADKLLKLSVDVGEGAPRTIVSGIALAYQPEQLVGRNVVVVANLKPRSLKGIESRGMLLTAGPGGKELSLLDPGPVAPGAEIK
jgi:methionyl-tRNA synthetase